MVDFASEEDAAPTLVPMLMRTKSFLGLRGAAKSLSWAAQIHVVFDYDEAMDYLAQHGAQGDRAPPSNCADGKDGPLIHVGNCRYTNDHGKYCSRDFLCFRRRAFSSSGDVSQMASGVVLRFASEIFSHRVHYRSGQ